MPGLPAYAELHCLTGFSFRRGAAHPAELVRRARELGYRALAITDECSMAGIVRAHEAAGEFGLKLIVGSEFFTACGLHLVLLAPDRAAYTEICRLITRARRRAGKGAYRLERADLESGLDHVLAIWKPGMEKGERGRGDRDSGSRSRDSGSRSRDSGLAAAARIAGQEDRSRLTTCCGQIQNPVREPSGIFESRVPSPESRSDRVPSPDPLTARWLMACFPGRLWLGATRLLRPGEAAHFRDLDALGRRLGIPRVAVGDVRMHRRGRRALMDALTALEIGRPVAECGLELAANGERHLRSLETLDTLYPRAWLDESVKIASACRFDLGDLNYRYPRELAPAPLTPAQHLRRLTLEGMARRWPEGAPEPVRAQVARELALVEEMGFEAFFLTVHDVVAFARSRGILCQGRGSAANSAVCYCLGVTEVDPSKQQLLFERFISRERNEPPDIDVDFEHERREEVLQYLYEKYGRERAALAATVICYRLKSALKDIGRALGLEPERVNRLTRSLAWWDRPEGWPERLRACGFDPDSRVSRQLLILASDLVGFPRHLSQHVGGMVISDEPLHHLVPVENAAMAERTVIQWDKDDLETLGLLKVDCLALGMLTALRKAMELVNEWENREPGLGTRDSGLAAAARIAGQDDRSRLTRSCRPNQNRVRKLSGTLESRVPSPESRPDRVPSPELRLSTIPREDPATYRMLQAGDAVGVFQVESRAQMAMLPRLRPECFYDLVIEVAIVRPGPIQGDMVHPYLERRAAPGRVTYPSPALKGVLERTLGVPIFQEQVMQIAIVAAGFTPGEADRLRRAMAAWKRRGGLEPFRDKLIAGMHKRGYSEAFAERIYRQIRGFGEYGFPESHAASFALLTYFSAWLKCHHPAAFTCGLLNSQPMGFYAPAQLINDAKRHGVAVRPVDVRFSGWDCMLEANEINRRRPAMLRRHDAGPGREMPAWQRRPTSLEGAGPGKEMPAWQRRPTSLEAGKRGIEDVSIRLGLRMVKGLKRQSAKAIVAARAQAPFADIQDLAERAGLGRDQLRVLAEAGALKGLAGHRHRARWQALGARRQGDLLAGAPIPEARPPLPPPSARDDLLDDYAALGLSLDHHPLKLLRPALGPRVRTAAQLRDIPDGTRIEAAGLVTHRQRPCTASGVIFMSLEDETGIINVIVWPKLADRCRAAVLGGRILRVAGTLQNARGVQHLVAEVIYSEDRRLAGLAAGSRDFC